MRRRSPALLLATLTCVLGLGACGDDSPSGGDASGTSSSESTCTYTKDGQPPAKEVEPPPAEPTVSGTVSAMIDTSVGVLAVRLDAESAPCAVGSFVSLADQGYFDGTRCHRLTTPQTGIRVLQCGDPTGTGSGGPGYSFRDELSGKETYPAGTLAMANAGPDTNGSQFFIVYGETPLPPSYTVFGRVDDAGLNVVQRVARKGTDDAFGPGDGHPRTPVEIRKVTIG